MLFGKVKERVRKYIIVFGQNLGPASVTLVTWVSDMSDSCKTNLQCKPNHSSHLTHNLITEIYTHTHTHTEFILWTMNPYFV